jgi:hypothetical protein
MAPFWIEPARSEEWVPLAWNLRPRAGVISWVCQAEPQTQREVSVPSQRILRPPWTMRRHKNISSPGRQSPYLSTVAAVFYFHTLVLFSRFWKASKSGSHRRWRPMSERLSS